MFTLNFCIILSRSTVHRPHFEEHWQSLVLLELSCASESPRERAVYTQMPGPHPQEIWLSSSGLGPRREVVSLASFRGTVMVPACGPHLGQRWLRLHRRGKNTGLEARTPLHTWALRKSFGRNSLTHSQKLGLLRVIMGNFYFLCAFPYFPNWIHMYTRTCSQPPLNLEIVCVYIYDLFYIHI